MSEARGLSCRELVELVTDYLEDALSPEDRTRFETHVGACQGCERYLHQMRETIRLTGRLTEERIPDDARRELLATFRGWRG